jgi:hypothetical protein
VLVSWAAECQRRYLLSLPKRRLRHIRPEQVEVRKAGPQDLDYALVVDAQVAMDKKIAEAGHRL